MSPEQLLDFDQAMLGVQVERQNTCAQPSAIQPQPIAQNLRRSHQRAAAHLLTQVAQQQFAGNAQAMGQERYRWCRACPFAPRHR